MGQILESAPLAEPQVEGAPVVESGTEAAVEALPVVEAVEAVTENPALGPPEALVAGLEAGTKDPDTLVQPRGIEVSSIVVMGPPEGNHFSSHMLSPKTTFMTYFFFPLGSSASRKRPAENPPLEAPTPVRQRADDGMASQHSSSLDLMNSVNKFLVGPTHNFNEVLEVSFPTL